MLLQLPKEIVFNIVACLDFHDKLTLMMTCRWLHELIVTNSLYKELSIPGRLQVTREVVKRFKNKELNGHQVKKLKLHLNYLTNQQYRRLPFIFPNVTEIINAKAIDNNYNNSRYYHHSYVQSYNSMSSLYSNGITYENERHEYVLEPLLKWKDSIETYDARSGHLQIAQLIQKNTFSRLVTLYFKPTVPILGSRQGGMNVDIFDCFKNAPQLRNLILCDFKVDLEFMEKTHLNCPRLHSLVFKNVVISTKNAVLPRVIEPAKTLSSLILEERTSLTDKNGQCVFLEYVSLKYKNLRYLELFTVFNNRVNLPQPADFFNGLRQTLSVRRNTNSSAYHGQSALITLPPLPSTLKVIKMDPTHFGNTMESLDQAGINPTKLEFRYERTQKYLSTNETVYQYFDPFNDANQLCYLEKATSLKTLSLSMKTTMQSNKNIVSESLTELNICIKSVSNNDNIDLDWILSVFPSLKALRIYSSNCTIEASKSRVHTIHQKLQTLKIIDCNIHPDLSDYIRVAAPNVKSLTFTVCDQTNQPMETLSYEQTLPPASAFFGPPFHIQQQMVLAPMMGPGFYPVNLPPVWNLQEGSSSAQPINLDDEPEQPSFHSQSLNLQQGSSYTEPINLDDDSDNESSNAQENPEQGMDENVLYKFDLSGCNIDGLRLLTRLRNYSGEPREILLQIITKAKTKTYTFIALDKGITRNISLIHTINDRLRSLPKIRVVCDSLKQLHIDLGTVINL